MSNKSTLKTKDNEKEDFKLSQWQLEQLARAIDINDVKKYVEEHHEDFLKFLKEEKKKSKLSNKNTN